MIIVKYESSLNSNSGFLACLNGAVFRKYSVNAIKNSLAVMSATEIYFASTYFGINNDKLYQPLSFSTRCSWLTGLTECHHMECKSMFASHPLYNAGKTKRRANVM